MNMVKPVAFALISANLVNAFFNWVLIYGKWGFPAMGTVGSGWSTAIARAYMAAVLVGYLLWYDHRHRTDLLKTPVDIDLPRIRRLIMLGLPAAMQFTLESGVFATVTALAARLGAVPLASHQIALNTVAFTYMVPLGISSAAAVRVGQAIGRKDPARRQRRRQHRDFSWRHFHGRSQHRPADLPSLDCPDVYAGRNRDSRHRLATGCRRRLSTLRRHSNRCHRRAARRRRHPHTHALPSSRLLGHRPAARCWLCFRRNWGAFGLWAGLSLALILIGIVLLFAWRRAVHRLVEIRWVVAAVVCGGPFCANPTYIL